MQSKTKINFDAENRIGNRSLTSAQIAPPNTGGVGRRCAKEPVKFNGAIRGPFIKLLVSISKLEKPIKFDHGLDVNRCMINAPCHHIGLHVLLLGRYIIIISITGRQTDCPAVRLVGAPHMLEEMVFESGGSYI